MSRYGLIAFAGYLVFLAATVPARLVLPHVGLPPSLAITEVRGSIWSGQAVLTTTAQPASILSRVRFHVWLGALLHGRWGYVLHGQGPLAGDVSVAVGRHRIELADMVLKATAGSVGPLVPGLRDAGASGAFVMRDRDWVMGAHAHGGGQLSWHDAGLVAAPVDPLGSYRVTFTMTPAGAVYRIRTLTGRLTITGGGHYEAASRMVSFRGFVTGHGLRLQGFLRSVGFFARHVGRPIRLRLPVAAL
ncbi:MAG: type II secretion system protein N [Gammaproteobacteria bacterium]|nr:type II secretion system protein N [Gammaproteobacteria bacterium]